MTEKKLDPELKKLILWRIETNVPKHFKLNIGGHGSFSKEELKECVQQENAIGIEYAKMQLKFIKALSTGEFSRVLASPDSK